MSTVLEFLQTMNWQHPIPVISTFVLGACIGSFLNVAIYRLPRGLSMNKPKRSFCPVCNKDIPGYRNIPLFTWLVQRGRCAECNCKIPFLYFAVELLTALLFLLMWVSFPTTPDLALFYMFLMALLVVVVFVDVELMVIPQQVIWLGTGLGLVAAVLVQQHLGVDGRVNGLIASVKGFLAGFGGLWAVVLLGKILFGKKKIEFAESVDWMLREPDDGNDDEQELCFVIDDEAHSWSECFYRKSDQIIIRGSSFRVDGKKMRGKILTIKSDRIELNGKTLMIGEMTSLGGQATKVTIPREAMGMGDVYLTGMLGTCLGWQSVLFTIFAACLFSIVLAILGRMKFGRKLPFGPSLAFGAVCWIFWGWQVWNWYFSLVLRQGGL